MVSEQTGILVSDSEWRKRLRESFGVRRLDGALVGRGLARPPLEGLTVDFWRQAAKDQSAVEPAHSKELR